MKQCEDNECYMAWWSQQDNVVSIADYLMLYEKDSFFWVAYHKTMKEEAEFFKFCPKCGNKVKDLLKKSKIVV